MLLIQARDEAKQARAYLNENIEQKAALACDHLRSALEHLGHVTGRTYHDELLDNIFSRFCIGIDYFGSIEFVCRMNGMTITGFLW